MLFSTYKACLHARMHAELYSQSILGLLVVGLFSPPLHYFLDFSCRKGVCVCGVTQHLTSSRCTDRQTDRPSWKE